MRGELAKRVEGRRKSTYNCKRKMFLEVIGNLGKWSMFLKIAIY